MSFCFILKKWSRGILEISVFKLDENAMLKHNNIRSCELGCLTTNRIRRTPERNVVKFDSGSVDC